MKTRTAFTKSMIVALALASALAFTGCSAGPDSQSPHDGGSKSADGGTDKAANDGGDSKVGGDLPADFPDAVPLVGGTVYTATGTAGLQWTVFLTVDDAESSMNLAREKLKAAGFEEVMWENPYMETSIMGMFSTDAYLVSVSTRLADDPQVVQYLVKSTG